MVLECKHVWEHISGYLDATLPPEVLEQVQWADWAADGTSLAVVRDFGGRNRLEFPIGKTRRVQYRSGSSLPTRKRGRKVRDNDRLPNRFRHGPGHEGLEHVREAKTRPGDAGNPGRLHHNRETNSNGKCPHELKVGVPHT